MTKAQIRKRDREEWSKCNGPVPEGYSIHHYWYSDEYDPESFGVIRNSEHEEIHGHHVMASKGTDYSIYYKEYAKSHIQQRRESWVKYNDSHREEINEKAKERYYKDLEKSRESAKERSKKYREEHREEIRIKQKENRERIKRRERLIALGVI